MKTTAQIIKFIDKKIQFSEEFYEAIKKDGGRNSCGACHENGILYALNQVKEFALGEKK